MKRDWWIGATLFAANLLILGPWLLTDFSDQPWNNGYIYMAIAKMFRELKWTWNPLQYAGAPFHYLYPPIFQVLVAAMPTRSIGLAFHLVTGVGYAVAPVAVYILARQLFERRLPAVFAAIAYSLYPSAAYLLPSWRALAAPYFHAPWSFVALVAYDEAGHAFALPFALLAIAAAWRDRWVIATLLAAAVLLVNWPALIGLGLILLALAVAKSPSQVIALTGAAYGLSAFWMTPGYFVSSSLLNRVVLRHTLTAAPFNRTTGLVLLGAAALIGLSFLHGVPARIKLLLTWVALTGAVIVSFTLAGYYLLPSPHRYMLEFNAGLILAIAGLISLAPSKWQPWFVAALMAAGAAPVFAFVTHAWKVEPKSADPRTGVAYQVADWLNRNAGGSRVYVSGELDSTLPLWSDVPQVGGSGQDISNFLIFAAERQVAYGCSADAERIAELWLRALHVRYLVVHGAASREYFHWFADPEKFAGLPVAWDNGAGDRAYAVPGFDPHDAVVVDLGEMERLPPMRSTHDAQFLEAYVRWAAGKRPASSGDKLGPGEAVLVKINNDPGWKGKTRSDPIGFLVVEGPAAQPKFGASWDTWLGRGITCFTILALVFVRRPRIWIAAAAVLPALAAYAVLMARAPSTVAVAEDAFVRLQPPIINPGGIVKNDGVVAVYGLNFGAPGDSVRALVSDRPAEVTYHGPNMVAFKMPVVEKATVSIEVNGCRGNEFMLTP